MTLVPGTTGQKLSPTQIYQLAQQAGFSSADAVTATAIALAESGGQTNVINSIGATGLWQIYNGSYPSAQQAQAYSDPLTNAKAAYAKFAAAQKTSCGGWWPWASYDEGPCAARNEAGRNNSWRTFLGMAQASATGTDIAGGGGSLTVPSGSSDGGTDTTVSSTVVSEGGGATSGGFQGLSLGQFGPWGLTVGTGVLWSVLFIFGAIALVGAGIYLVFRQQINSAVGGAAQAAAVAA